MQKTNAVFWQNFVNLEDRKLIDKTLENDFDWYEKEKIYHQKDFTKVKIIQYKNLKHIPIIKTIIDQMYYVNRHYIGFDIEPFTDDRQLHLNNYQTGMQSGWHNDASKMPTKDHKLTGIINISTEDYEGGEFEVNETHEPLKIKQFSKGGDIIMFKSHMLHRVLPVTKGVRKTLAFFLIGPNFR